jgi:hypothetical protein
MSLMWSWHWSPLAQTKLLLSPSDGLASFLKTTLANNVKVVKKVITSKFRFHLIAIVVFSQFQLHTCTYQNYLEGPPLWHLDQWLIFYWPKKKFGTENEVFLSDSKSVQVFFIICLYIYVLPLENQLSSGEGQDLINRCNMLHFCGRLKPGPKFQTSYVVVFIFDQLVVVRGDCSFC